MEKHFFLLPPSPLVTEFIKTLKGWKDKKQDVLARSNMLEDLAYLGASPRPTKAWTLDEILRKGLGEMGNCPIPNDLWDELVLAGMPERLCGVQQPEGKGYPSSETEVMLGVPKGKGVLPEVQVQQGEEGGPKIFAGYMPGCFWLFCSGPHPARCFTYTLFG